MDFELSSFSRSSLEESKAMSFLNRFDTKYVLKAGGARGFLENVKDSYSLLEINGEVVQSYRTVYFDTPDLHCFNMHHNKRARRYKFRTRQYLSNGKIYNEIKQKLNTGKTVKFRLRRDEAAEGIEPLADIEAFDGGFHSLARSNGYWTGVMEPSLLVFFSRITLLNKSFPERMTLDFGVKYRFGGVEARLPDTAIVELKRDRTPHRTAAQDFFRSAHKNPGGFSKYAIGVSLTHSGAKKNRFMPRLRKLACEIGERRM